MKTSDLQELAARITAPMRTTGGRAFLEIVPLTSLYVAYSRASRAKKTILGAGSISTECAPSTRPSA
jgi:hypothetical protein